MRNQPEVPGRASPRGIAAAPGILDRSLLQTRRDHLPRSRLRQRLGMRPNSAFARSFAASHCRKGLRPSLGVTSKDQRAVAALHRAQLSFLYLFISKGSAEAIELAETVNRQSAVWIVLVR